MTNSDSYTCHTNVIISLCLLIHTMLLYSTEISCCTPVVLAKFAAVCQLNLLNSHANKQGLAANVFFALFLSKGTEDHNFVQTLVLADSQNNTKSWFVKFSWTSKNSFL